MPRARVLLAVAAVVAATLGACSSDDAASTSTSTAAPAPTATEQQYVDAFSTTLQADGIVPLPADAAGCVATASIEAIGVDALHAAGVSPDQLAAAQSIDALGLQVDDDARAQLVTRLDACDLEPIIGPALASSLAGEAGVAAPEGTGECMSEALGNHGVTSALAATYVGGGAELADAVTAALGDCPDLLAAMIAAGVQQTLGHPLSAEAIACIRDQIIADTPAAVAVVTSAAAGGDASQSPFFVQMGQACAAQLDAAGG